MLDSAPSKKILDLGEAFYDPVKPAVFPQHLPRYLNESEALSLGLKLKSDLAPTENSWAYHFAQFNPLPGNLPQALALRYHGHQFRHYNPDLGDGRGFLFAQFLIQDKNGQQKLLDLGTKGSGQTPYSRSGDGRLTLKGAYREALATELLESLGVNTSKTFCFFETGEKLERNDEPSPTRGAVLTRLSHGHIRFGTFQRLAYLGETDNIKILLKYCLKNYFPNLQLKDDPSTEAAFSFLREVSLRAAELTAEWMIAGFVHGVLNTDNMNITGESFDYGPYRFLPSYDPGFTAAYFDQNGLYSFGRQPNSVFWNLQQLAGALLKAYPDLPVSEALEDFGALFASAVAKKFLRRLNLRPKTSDPQLTDELLVAFYQALEVTQAPYEQTCFDFFGGKSSPRVNSSPQAHFYQMPLFRDLQQVLSKFEVLDATKMNHPYLQNDRACSLLIEEIESLWKDIAENDDWSGFNRKLKSIRSFRGLY